MNIIFAEGANPLSFLSGFGVEWKMLVSQGLMFIVLSVIIYKLAFKPVLKIMDERKATIEKGLADADEASKKLAQSQETASAQIAAAAKEASEILAKTREDAKFLLEKSAKDAADKAAEIIKAANQEIETDRLKMKSELKAELAGLLVKTTEALLKENLDDSLRAKLANSAAQKINEEK